ncbi:hypothetical protein NCS57_00434000 [Fusarium keratoplasticum]|uniref:Uncharacterized protein n=1 Tax=Fusarium keratoplasticum TaxID=1328300 RepID=A0ACC0R8B9_9HYPO|nr:hypothetical protein NCS57_00434000 [Fusarium keratoplasticum]KAI8675330.1 hypothetical protein NCS57_00434000 [Fusarium keratoplasticum]
MSNIVATVDQGTLSPYLGTVSALVFNGNHVWAHGRLIRKHPNFAARFKHNQLHMKPVPQGAAHILVHYLYTERYEGLKAIGNRELDKTKFQFRMAVHVYDLAREYNLYQLEDLAADELVTLTPMLQVGTMITILDQEESTHTKISGWLRDYISHEVMTAGKAATPSVVRGMSDDMKHNRPITGIVCEAMARMGMENQRLRRALKEK